MAGETNTMLGQGQCIENVCAGDVLLNTGIAILAIWEKACG